MRLKSRAHLKQLILQRWARHFNEISQWRHRKKLIVHNFQLICVNAGLFERVHKGKAQGKGERS